MQVKIFSAMILDLPHIVSGNYGKLLKDLKTEIFNKEHNLKIYYVCSLVYSQLLDLYDNLYIDEKYWKFRFHILMIFKYLVTSQKTPNLKTKKEIEKYCDDLLNICNNEESFKKMIRDSVDILTLDVVDIDMTDRKSPELKSNTDIIYNYLKENFSKFKNKNIEEYNEINNKGEEKLKVLVQKSLFEF